MLTLGFGGGCHWCTEAVFQSLAGVVAVRQGFIRSDAPYATWSEAVEVDFDPDRISTIDLVGVHLSTHASTSRHKMRGKYRSAIYAFEQSVVDDCSKLLDQMSEQFGLTFVTQALPHRGFKASDSRFQNYYQSGPERPFRQSYIEPKLSILRRRFQEFLRPEAIET